MTKNLRLLLYVGIGIPCVLGFLFPYPHPHFWWQKIPIFDALFGFGGCVLIIMVSKGLGHRWLMKDEGYYD